MVRAPARAVAGPIWTALGLLKSGGTCRGRPRAVTLFAPGGGCRSQQGFREVLTMGLQFAPGHTRVGWIGTGVMGSSMCGHLLTAGYTATVYNRSRDKVRPLV